MSTVGIYQTYWQLIVKEKQLAAQALTLKEAAKTQRWLGQGVWQAMVPTCTKNGPPPSKDTISRFEILRAALTEIGTATRAIEARQFAVELEMLKVVQQRKALAWDFVKARVGMGPYTTW